MAAPNAPFLRAWHDAYYGAFVPDGWDEASVVLPFQLHKARPDLSINARPETAFFLPSWSNAAQAFYASSTEDVRDDAYAYHLWDSAVARTNPSARSVYRDARDVWPLKANATNLFEKIIRYLGLHVPAWNSTVRDAFAHRVAASPSL